MKKALSIATLLTMALPGSSQARMLTDAEATFLDQLVTAAAVLEQRCPRYEADGTGGVQLGARLLGSPDAAMAMIDAYSASILALDGKDYDFRKFRPEVMGMAAPLSKRLRNELIRFPERACAQYGEISADRGLLRRY